MAIFICNQNQFAGCPANRKARAVCLRTEVTPGIFFLEANMKRVVDGKKFDTDTADLIAEWDNGFYGSDFKRCRESLYRSKKGAWFVCGSGGPMSKYARPVGNMMTGGDGLEPISELEARQWLEQKHFVSEIEAHFQVEEA
jgi:hypothetical protein